MSIDVSRLGIVVESQGIDTARKSLDGGNGRGGLAGAAEKTERNVERLTSSVKKLLAQDSAKFSAAMTQGLAVVAAAISTITREAGISAKAISTVINPLGKVTSASAKAAAGMQGYAAGTSAATAAAARLNAVLGQQAMVANVNATALNNLAANARSTATAKQGLAHHTGTAVTTLKAMTTAAIAYAAVNLGSSIVSQADSWVLLKARMQNATGSQHNANVGMEQMYELSQRLRVPLEDNIKLYNRLAPAVQRMGKDSAYARDMVEGISAALQLSGANGAEASSVMLQLSQSFSSGVLNGAEFNAVAENGSVLMRLLEKHTGKSTYELKKMGAEGKFAMSIFGEAVQANLPWLREQFDRLPMTFEGATQRIKNAWLKAVGEMGENTLFNRELAASLRTVEEMIPGVANGLGGAFISVMGWIRENKTELQEVGEAGMFLLRTVYESVRQFIRLGTTISETGKTSNVFKSTLEVVSLLIAGAADGANLLYSAGLGVLGVFTHIFNALQGIVVGPLFLMLKGFQKFAEFNAWATGDKATADKAKDLEAMADGLANYMGSVSDSASSMFAKSDKILEDFRNGATATQKVLNGFKSASVNKPVANVSGLRAMENDMLPSEMDEKAWNASTNPKKREDPKAEKAIRAEEERYVKLMERLTSELRKQELIRDRMAAGLPDYDKLGPAQKELIDLQQHLLTLERALGTSRATAATTTAINDQKKLIAEAEKVALLEVQNQKTKERLSLEAAGLEKQTSRVSQLEEEAKKLENQVATYGMAKGAVEELELAESRRRLADLSATSDASRTPAMEKMILLLQEEVKMRERISAASEQLGTLEVEDKFNKLFDPAKAERFADAMVEGFGRVGKAVGGVIKAFQGYEARMSKVQKGWELYQKETDPTKRTKMAERLYQEEATARLTSYADMAGAAKGYFKEGSKGYEALEAAEKTFRVFQMAMQLKSFLAEMFQEKALVTAKVTSDAQVAASDSSRTATEVANSQIRGTAKAAEAGANQASGGDPYTAFARVAMMVALMAALGFAVGGGGGSVDIAEKRQQRQGTGTVFGDADAKSESISNSLERLTDQSDIALGYSAGMLTSLQNIEYSLTGATAGVIRQKGLTGAGFEDVSTGGGVIFDSLLTGVVGGQLGSLLGGVGSVVNSIGGKLGFGTSKKLKDSGIVGMSQSVGDILANGFDLQGYQTVEKKKKAFGVSYSKKTKESRFELDESIGNEFENIIGGMVDTLGKAGEILGVTYESVVKRLSSQNIDIGRISLKGLTGEEIERELEAVFSAIGDDLTKVALPSVVAFQRSGEGLLETAVRVSSGVEAANYELEKLGIAAISYADIVDTYGDVAAEIVKQSIAAAEPGEGIIAIIESLTGTASEIASTYSALSSIRDSLVELGVASDVSRDLIRAAGGLEALQDAMDAYKDSFFSEAEQQVMSVRSLQREFQRLGLSLPETKDGFRQLVAELSATGASGEELATKVILLSDAYSEAFDVYVGMLQSAQDTVNDVLGQQIDSLTEYAEKFSDFSKTIGEFATGLLTGDLSTLSASEKYSLVASEFESVLSSAMMGDEDALAKFTDVSQAFLQASREVNASGAGYEQDFSRVYAAAQELTTFTASVAAGASSQESILQAQLDALNAQADAIAGVDNSVKSVEQAILALTTLIAGGLSGTSILAAQPTVVQQTVLDGSHAGGLDYVPFDGYIAEPNKGEAILTAGQNAANRVEYSGYGANNTVALVEEIKALRAEVVQLREGQRDQTGRLVAAAFTSSALNAQTIVDGQKEIASTGAYSERAKVTLV